MKNLSNLQPENRKNKVKQLKTHQTKHEKPSGEYRAENNAHQHGVHGLFDRNEGRNFPQKFRRSF